jgi:hypothetical protein
MAAKPTHAARSVVVDLDRGRQRDPWVTRILIDRDRRRRKRGVSQSANRDGDHVRHRRHAVVDRRAAFGAKAEPPLVTFLVGQANVLRRTALDAHLILREPSLDPEHAAGSLLAGELNKATHVVPVSLELES